MIGPVAADLAQRRARPRRRCPPASGRQPQCSAATAPSAASRTGRQSATKTIAAASVSAVAWPSSSRVGPLGGRRLGRAPDGRAVDLAPVTEARPRMADALAQPAPVLGDVLRRVVGQQAEVQRRRTGRSTRRRARCEKTARACGRSATIWSSSQRKSTAQEGMCAAAQLRVAVRRAAVEHRLRRARQALPHRGAGQARGDQVVARDREPAVADVVEPALGARVAGRGEQLDGLGTLAAQKAPQLGVAARPSEP